jgi:hypothetical protein
MSRVTYDIRFNGTGYEVFRTRTFYLAQPVSVVVDTFDTREAAEVEVKFQEALDRDKARDRAGR